MLLTDYIVSLIRTYVPAAVAGLVAWLAANYNIVLPDDTSAALALGVAGLVLAVYYGLVRALEQRWPWFGKLLGASKQPVYTPRSVARSAVPSGSRTVRWNE